MPETLDSSEGLDLGIDIISEDVGEHEIPNLHDITPLGEGGLDLGIDALGEPGRPPEQPQQELTPEQELINRGKFTLAKDVKDILYDMFLSENPDQISNSVVDNIESPQVKFIHESTSQNLTKCSEATNNTKSDFLLDLLSTVPIDVILEKLVARGWDIDILLKDYIGSRKENEVREYFKNLIKQSQTVVLTGEKHSNILLRRSSMKVKINNGTISTTDTSAISVADAIRKNVHLAKAGFRKLADMKIKHSYFKTAEDLDLKELGAEKFLDAPKPTDSDISKQLEEVKDLLNKVLESISEGISFRDQNQTELSVDELKDLDSAISEGNEFLNEGNSILELEEKGKGKEKKEEKGKEKGQEKGKEKEKEKEEKEALFSSDIRIANSSRKEEVLHKLRERNAKLKQSKEAQLYGSWKDLCTQKQDAGLNVKKVPGLKGKGDNLPVDNSPISQGKRTDISEFKVKFPKPKIASNEHTDTSTKRASEAVSRAVKAALTKARLAASLACQQQLKGLIGNPLKAALVEELTTTLGVDESVADAIVHNAYVKGYEASQVNIIKEAFDFLYHQDIDKFSEILKFVKAYDGSQDTPKLAWSKKQYLKKSSVADTASDKIKTASAPLRSTPATPVKDESRKMYADFWRAYQIETFRGKSK